MNRLLFAMSLLAATDAVAASDLQTTWSVNVSPALTYSTARYTVAVKNIGNKSAANVTVSVDLPATHTSPQVYVLGLLGARSATCALTGTTLNCTLGSVARNTTKTVYFDIALPVSSEPFEFEATSATTSAENSLANNTVNWAAAETYASTPIAAGPGSPVTMLNSHCTGTNLTAWYECTLFPGSVSTHEAVLHDGGTITVPVDPTVWGAWTLTPTIYGNMLEFSYSDPSGLLAEFIGWGVDGSCFEGLTTFPGSIYVAPYEVCPL